MESEGTKMSKYQEALDTLCDDEKKSDLADSFSFDKYYTPQFCDDIAIEKCREPLQELVDRATPKKLDYEGDGYADGVLIYNTAICRSCGKNFEVDYDEHANYCPNCGQALDWSEDNE